MLADHDCKCVDFLSPCIIALHMRGYTKQLELILQL